MSDLQVPDFNTLRDFKIWAALLDDKEIQAWTTKDWLKVYEKIDAYVMSPDFDKIYREMVPKLIEKNVFVGTAEDLVDRPSIPCKRIAFLSDEATKNCLGHLYSNYRFEPQQLEVIKRLGKEAGEKMSQKKDIDLATLAIKTKNKTPEGIYNVMKSANEITIGQTSYSNDSNYRNWFSVGVNDKMEDRGRATGKGELFINSRQIADESIHVSFHETAHLHMQNKFSWQRTHISPAIDNLGSDFHKLMEKNMDYYITFHQNVEYSPQRKPVAERYKRYHKQPVERFSEIYGIEAERVFRSKTGQYSERNAIKVNDILREKTYLGHPQKAFVDENGFVNLIYKPDAENLEEIFTKQLSEVDENIIKKINLIRNANGTVGLRVPKDISFTNALNTYKEKQIKKAFRKAENSIFKAHVNTITQIIEKNETKLEEKLSLRSSSPESFKVLNHDFTSVADIKGVEKIDLYHGSRNFFENYDYTKARTVGGAQYGLGQYFTTKENMAYSYATLDKESPFIEKNIETNGEKVATQKVVYHGEITGEDLNHILVPEKMTDLDYDALIKAAEQQEKADIAQELSKIKAVAQNRDIDLCQWLRKTENVQFMQSAGINGIYSPDREIYAIYDTSKMNIKVKEAIVLNGTNIPKSLLTDNSIIHIQEELVNRAEEAHILTTEGNALQKASASAGETINATIGKSAENAVTLATEKVATKSAMKATAAKAGEKVAKTAKTAGKAAKETLLAANKAYDDTFDAIMKWGDKHAPQWMNKVEEKTVQKAAEKFMKTKSGQAIAKQIEKKIGKEAAISIAKKIPLICLGVGAMCVYDRLKEGEILKAVGEGTSALAANVPGLGTLVSFGLDGAMLSDDLKIFEHGVMPRDPNSHVAAESTFVEKPEIRQDKLVRKVDKAAEAKKKAAEEKKKEESKKKAQKFEANLYKYGDKSGNSFGG